MQSTFQQPKHIIESISVKQTFFEAIRFWNAKHFESSFPASISVKQAKFVKCTKQRAEHQTIPLGQTI
jgi:hypothetical protein